MPLNPGGSEGTPDGAADNEGPHCRNCHTGANSCNQCHGTKADGSLAWYYSDRTNLSSNPYTIHGNVQGAGNPYQPQQYVHTSAVANVNGQCIDGGFSFPHRTLGANLLKDELYGVDYDGTPVSVGETRSVPGWFEAYNYGVVDAWNWQSPYATDYREGTYSVLSSGTGNTWQNANAPRPYSGAPAYLGASTPIEDGALVENLDSVCIDCHGDATFWNGDDTQYYYEKTYEAGVVSKGWELMWKGLP
ncbi:MAG: hypothetical protein KGZ40_03575 [Clostridiales bacterium]|nr:hypothetical protein [Clostridiales bacterium]